MSAVSFTRLLLATHFELASLELSIYPPEFDAINTLLSQSKTLVFAITFADGACSIGDVPDRVDGKNLHKRLVFSNLDKRGYDMLQEFECLEV